MTNQKEEKRKNWKKEKNQENMNSRILDIYLAMSIIRLNVNGLNVKIKGQSLLDWIKHTTLLCATYKNNEL